ncbi:hypothetical protein GGR57DRAFT_160696 [Xylariaceae sp. FL1272]|nr:hypothetical protein GGR57DRAFT_160696 [Xylariaceae sp. FL1272]
MLSNAELLIISTSLIFHAAFSSFFVSFLGELIPLKHDPKIEDTSLISVTLASYTLEIKDAVSQISQAITSTKPFLFSHVCVSNPIKDHHKNTQTITLPLIPCLISNERMKDTTTCQSCLSKHI